VILLPLFKLVKAILKII